MESSLSPGGFLRAKRLSAQESMADIAQRLKTYKSAISLYERNEKAIPVKVLPMVKQAYGLDEQSYLQLKNLIRVSEQKYLADYKAALGRLAQNCGQYDPLTEYVFGKRARRQSESKTA